MSDFPRLNSFRTKHAIGTISQWGEVKKKTKEKVSPKSKESNTTASHENPVTQFRGGRGRGTPDTGRGGRGRGTDRGRGSARGTRAGHAGTNGVRPVKSEANAASTDATSGWASSWDTQNESTALDASWENITPESVPAAVSEPAKPSSKPDGTRSWASMFAKPKATPPPPKSEPVPNPAETATSASLEPETDPSVTNVEGLPPPIEVEEIPSTPLVSHPDASDAADLTPPADQLTETNLEQLPDSSNPPPTATAASTAASTVDPRSAGTPLQPFPGKVRPPMGGYATTAWKATNANRSASFQRKVQEQHEAVVMPGKHGIDRATVQFGSMGLGDSSEDVDSERGEDPETRAQPPQHSPVAPRASLPSAPPQQPPFTAQAPNVEPQAAPRQAPGLPPLSHSQQDQPLTTESLANQSDYGYKQFNDRYGNQAPQPGFPQKSFEPFGQQAQGATSDAYPSSSQAPQLVPGTTAGHESSSFYSSDNQRNTYQNNLYGNYQPSQEPGSSQQRAGTVFGTSAGPQSSQYATSHGQPGRFNQEQNSGHSTPNLALPGQPPMNQPHQMPHGQHGGQHSGYYGGYPYAGYNSYSPMNYMNQPNTHLYGRDRLPFDDVRRYDDQFLSQNHPQYGYGGSQGGYGGFGSGGKQGMYGGHHQGYGISPQASYDQHSSSPANSGAFGSQLPSSGRDATAPSSLSNYGRSGSTQPAENQQQFPGSGAGSHSNVSDVFGRSGSGFQGHSQGLGGGNDENLRYNDTSKVQGPSPSHSQPGRPGSAANQQGQSGYGGYPQGSQYGGGPGGMNHQSGGHSQPNYGYGGNFGNFYGNNNRGGWGSYGH